MHTVALYQKQSSWVTFDALTANISWHIYINFAFAVVTFCVLYCLTERLLLSPKRQVLTLKLSKRKKHCSTRLSGALYMPACYRLISATSSIEALERSEVSFSLMRSLCSLRQRYIRQCCCTLLWCVDSYRFLYEHDCAFQVHRPSIVHGSTVELVDQIRTGQRRLMLPSPGGATRKNFLLVPGAPDALQANPPVYMNSQSEKVPRFNNQRPSTSDQRVLTHLRSSADAMLVSTESVIKSLLQQAEDLCEGAYALHYIDEITAVNMALVFAKSSNFTKPFSILAADRLEEFARTYHLATTLSEKCKLHFFPNPNAEVSEGNKSRDLKKLFADKISVD